MGSVAHLVVLLVQLVRDPVGDQTLIEDAAGEQELMIALEGAAGLQEQLAKGRYLLPLAFPDEVVAAHDVLRGPVIRQVTDPSDRFWDVLTWRLADGR
mgnify:CR=1 FL=1